VVGLPVHHAIDDTETVVELICADCAPWLCHTSFDHCGRPGRTQ
jgi:hypothetical protein